MGSPEIVTPDGLTEAGKQYIEKKLAGKYNPDQVKTVLQTLDTASRWAMLNRDNKVADAFKRAMPLVDSTSEKMTKEYAKLFEKQIPQDIDELLTNIKAISEKKYNS